MKQWAEKNKVFDSAYRIFGFNNPGLEAMKEVFDKKGQPYFITANPCEYGYEFWMTVNDSIIPENNGRGVEIKRVPGGKFAVMSIGVGCEEHDIEKGWAKFSQLLKSNGHTIKERWFEEHLEFDPEKKEDHFRMDLYVEIA